MEPSLNLLVVSNGEDMYLMRWNSEGLVAWSKAFIDSTVSKAIYDVEFADGTLSILTRPDAQNTILTTMTFPVVSGDTQDYIDLQYTEVVATNPSFAPAWARRC